MVRIIFYIIHLFKKKSNAGNDLREKTEFVIL